MVKRKSFFLVAIFSLLLFIFIVPGMYLFGYYMDQKRDDSYYLSIICDRFSIDMENPNRLGTILDKQYDYVRDFHLEAVVQLTDEGLAFLAQHAQKTPVSDIDTESILEQCSGMLVLEDFQEICEQSAVNGKLWMVKRKNFEEINERNGFDFCLIDQRDRMMYYFGVEW